MNTMKGKNGWKWATIILAALLLATLTCAIGVSFGGFLGYRLGKAQASSSAGFEPHAELPSLPSYPAPGPSIERPWLGVAYQMQEEGARIVEVIPGSPADEAGLRPGDLVTEVEGTAVTAERPLADLILRYAPGDEITLTIKRDGRTKHLSVVLDDATSQPMLPMAPPPPGQDHHGG